LPPEGAYPCPANVATLHGALATDFPSWPEIAPAGVEVAVGSAEVVATGAAPLTIPSGTTDRTVLAISAPMSSAPAVHVRGLTFRCLIGATGGGSFTS